MNMEEEKKVLETALLCAQEPLSLQDMRSMFENDGGQGTKISLDRFRSLIEELKNDWSGKGLELVSVSMETLAIIAYNQPVTRGDIERIRGVTVNAQSIRLLEERGWIEVIGHREVPGRPGLLATTSQFLSDLGLASLEQLPPLQELQEMDMDSI